MRILVRLVVILSLAALSRSAAAQTTHSATICEQMKDPARNGGHSTGEAVIEHMKSDPLILWAWNPGTRTTPPLSHEKFVVALEAWVHAGMPCS